ncbi:M24 family metallopeptidase [Methanopyrus sp.]
MRGRKKTKRFQKILKSEDFFLEKVERLEELVGSEPCALVRRQNVEWITHFPGMAFHADFESEEYTLVVHRMDSRAVREWPVPDIVEVVTHDEADRLTPARAVDDESAARRVPCYRVKNVNEDVTRARLSKSRGELRFIEEMVKTTERILEGILPPEGSEAEVASDLVREAVTRGFQTAFDPIVAYDEGAGVPHHRPSPEERTWTKCALVDYGIKMVYCTDITRTVVSGDEAGDVLEVVVSALEEALRELRAGVNPKELEEELREWMEDEAPGFEFPHSLGHHVGVTVHEGRLKGRLPEGAVITVEPGLYSDEFGVRVEEMVVVGKRKCRTLTKLPRVWER